ncbi:MAG: DUF805 domain-containing protein [candidate division KSB1 bacterium]|nr:DUF805 domain-containing protein [candidate division KSB1 bacterium]
MNNATELHYIALLTPLISVILQLALASSARSLVGRGWLIASAALTLLSSMASRILSLLIDQRLSYREELFRWYDVAALPTYFSVACFGMFLFSIWSGSRMKLDMRGLLFSFSGRIPRSAFWIMVCILFPLGTLVGIMPFNTRADGFAKGIIWAVYAAWGVLSIWISLAVYAKRWHDCGRSGWMSLILLLPIVGVFWFLAYCGFVRGTSGPNQYGDDPLSTGSA